MGDSLSIWISLVSAIFGGIGLKVVESLVIRKQKQQDLISKLLEQANAQIMDLKGDFRIKEQEYLRRIDEKEAEANAWQDKYWTLRESQNKG